MNLAYKTVAGRQAVAAAYAEILTAWPVAHEEIRLATREGETFVLACGPKGAPPVILCHGAQANAASWMLDIPAWARRFRIYALDMIGEAGLSAPSRPPLEAEAHALWLDDVMAGLGLERAALVGISLGGWLALDYAVRRPGRVSRLAVLCPAGVGPQKNFLLKAAPLLLLGAWGRDRMREMVLGKAPANPSAEQARFGAFMGLVGTHVRPRPEKIPIFSDQALRGLSMPLLAILGGRDVLLDTAAARARLTALVPQARIVWLPEAGHYLVGQTELIGEFLGEGAA